MVGGSSRMSSASNLWLSAGRGKRLDLAPWIIQVVIPARMRVRVGVTLSLSPSCRLDLAEEPTEGRNYSGIPPDPTVSILPQSCPINTTQSALESPLILFWNPTPMPPHPSHLILLWNPAQTHSRILLDPDLESCPGLESRPIFLLESHTDPALYLRSSNWFLYLFLQNEKIHEIPAWITHWDSSAWRGSRAGSATGTHWPPHCIHSSPFSLWK